MHGEALNIGWLGFIVFGIVIGSLFLILLSSVLGKPWKPKVTVVFVGMIFTLAIVFVAFTWLFGGFLSIFVP